MSPYSHYCRALLICLGISASAALATLLTACGDHGGATIPTVNAASTTFSHHQTFQFTGKPQRFKVPQVQWLHVVVRGAGGAGTSDNVARGGRVSALIPASIDRELVVYVGGAGNLTTGGYNGGGDGGTYSRCSSCGYGGGGASDIRLAGGTLGGRVIVAGGGGGGGGSGLHSA
ncbi:MAG: glycine-rich protein, partial [Candidatus Cybelea sp.]